MHHTNKIREDVDAKPEIISHYNCTKGGVDSLDQLVHAYMCKRRTNRWPFAFFMNGLDVSGVAAYVVWMNTHPNWNANKHFSRRLFIQSVSESLVQVHIERRSNLGLSTNIIMAKNIFDGGISEPTHSSSKIITKRRCYICPYSKHRKQKQICNNCEQSVCNEHSDIKRVCKKC